jgi:hypothetical protein
MITEIRQWIQNNERWFYPGTPVSSTNKTDRHDITEILLKVALNTINQNPRKMALGWANGPNLLLPQDIILSYLAFHCFGSIV